MDVLGQAGRGLSPNGGPHRGEPGQPNHHAQRGRRRARPDGIHPARGLPLWIHFSSVMPDLIGFLDQSFPRRDLLRRGVHDLFGHKPQPPSPRQVEDGHGADRFLHLELSIDLTSVVL